MKRDHYYIPILLMLVLIKFAVHFIGNKNYGFHRDELLHLSVSEHLDWGFMEFPPFIGVLGKLSYYLFDYSLSGVRLFATLAGVIILILCGLIAKELGGKSGSIFLAGICILAFLPFYRNHTLFQPVAFDQLFWTLGFYFLVKLIKSNKTTYLILLGITLGLGLMNKYTMVVWGIGVFVGLFFYKKGNLFKNKWTYVSGIIALLIFLPNLIWQIQHDIPFLKHLSALGAKQKEVGQPFGFVLDQLNYPFTLAVSVLGISALLFGIKKVDFKPVGISILVIFLTMWALHAKTYYVFGIYPVLFAAGSVEIERLLAKRPQLILLVAGLLIVPILYSIPRAIPIIPIQEYVSYRGLSSENGVTKLNSDYADMFGWEEQVLYVDSLYKSIPLSERKDCIIWAANYGEAGAIKILGKKYGLPDPICVSGTFWLWGYKNKNASKWICIGIDDVYIKKIFIEAQHIKTIHHPYAIDEEQGISIYLCSKPRVDIEEFWKDYADNIFD